MGRKEDRQIEPSRDSAQLNILFRRKTVTFFRIPIVIEIDASSNQWSCVSTTVDRSSEKANASGC